jgi:hypothetical protein
MNKPSIDYTLHVGLADESGRICISSPELPGLLIWARPNEAFADLLGSIKKLRDLNRSADTQG